MFNPSHAMGRSSHRTPSAWEDDLIRVIAFPGQKTSFLRRLQHLRGLRIDRDNLLQKATVIIYTFLRILQCASTVTEQLRSQPKAASAEGISQPSILGLGPPAALQPLQGKGKL